MTMAVDDRIQYLIQESLSGLLEKIEDLSQQIKILEEKIEVLNTAQARTRKTSI